MARKTRDHPDARAADRHRQRGHQDHFPRNPEHPRLGFGLYRDRISTTINDLDTSFGFGKRAPKNASVRSNSRFCAHLGTFLPKTLSPPSPAYCNIVTGVKPPPHPMFKHTTHASSTC